MSLLALIALICVSMVAGAAINAGSTRWAYAKGHRGGLDSGLIRGEARGRKAAIEAKRQADASDMEDIMRGIQDPPRDPATTGLILELANMTMLLPRANGRRYGGWRIPRQRGWGR
jgi:hypothetical protein